MDDVTLDCGEKRGGCGSVILCQEYYPVDYCVKVIHDSVY